MLVCACAWGGGGISLVAGAVRQGQTCDPGPCGLQFLVAHTCMCSKGTCVDIEMCLVACMCVRVVRSWRAAVLEDDQLLLSLKFALNAPPPRGASSSSSSMAHAGLKGKAQHPVVLERVSLTFTDDPLPHMHSPCSHHHKHTHWVFQLVAVNV